jgi:hypothetical protein
MYQKHLRDLEDMYFRHAPPQAFRSQKSFDKLPNPPFAGAAPWQCSVYYYWWLFLREDQITRKAEPDIGLISLDFETRFEFEIRLQFGLLTEKGFLRWWIRQGRFLFCEPVQQGVKALTCIEVDYGVPPPSGERTHLFDPSIYLQVPVHQDFDKSIEEVRAFLRQAKERQRTETQDEALFPVFTKPVLTALEKTYQAMVLRNRNPEMLLADIAVSAGLAARTDNTDPATRSANASAASRALKQASYLTKWVSKGVFPVTRKSQEVRAAEFSERQLIKFDQRPFIIERGRKKLIAKSNVKSNTNLEAEATRHGLDLHAVR